MLFLRFRIGIVAYLAYIFLVPYMKIPISGFVLEWNFMNLLLLVAFFYNLYRNGGKFIKYDWRPLYPFVLYFGVSLILMPFQDGVPFFSALNAWRMSFMKCLILPFVIWYDIQADSTSVKLYRNVTIGCIVIAALYGLYLTTMPGFNPYMSAISFLNGREFNLAYAAGNSSLTDNTILSDDRLFGRICSVFSHPMTFGLFLGFALLYVYRNRGNLANWFFYGLTFLILTNIIVCGVRSVIGATFIAILFLLLQSRNFALFMSTALGGFFIWYVVSANPILSNFFSSITDLTSSNVQGSSFEMRILQLEGCFEEIKNVLLEGKGFHWTGYYILHHEEGHPTILHFESLVFVILCNSGLIGVLLWFLMGKKIFNYNNRKMRSAAALLNSLFVFYIAYACITGEYGYMQYFIIFYILTLGEHLYQERILCTP